MERQRKIIAAFVFGIAISSAARAGMVIVSHSDIEPRQSETVCDRVELASGDSSGTFSPLSFQNIDTWSVGFLTEASTNFHEVSQMPVVRTLSDGSSSFNLCLCALISLGVCRYIQKKQSVCLIPKWLEQPAFFESGPGRALVFIFSKPLVIYSLIQSAFQAVCSFSVYLPKRIAAVISLARESKSKLEAVLSRGPPTRLVSFA